MSDVNNDKQNREELSEAAWRRRLTPEEQARLRQHLAAHPGENTFWESEVALTRALNRLPVVPVSSNFTALVIQAARKSPMRRGWWTQLDDWFPSGWRPRLALGTAMVCLSFLTACEYRAVARHRMTRELASVGSLASSQPVDWMENFDTIKDLSRVEVADEELLKVLQ